MTHNQPTKPVFDRIVEAVQSGRVKMRPKWHFILRTVLAIVGAILILCTLLYLASFILFVLRTTGVLFVPTFGFHGWFVFLVSLPWLLIVAVLVFVVILEILVRRYSFAYRRPLFYSAMGILLIVILGGYFVETSHVHRGISMYARDRHIPFAGRFYRGYGEQRFQNIYPGVIKEMAPQGFMLQSRRGETLEIFITPNTRISQNEHFIVGEHVIVFGQQQNTTVHAIGIRRMSE